jgi:hypothetical protein
MRKSLIPLTLAVLVLAATGASAQIEPAPYITIHYDRIDPAHLQAWEGNARDWVTAFSKAGIGVELGWRGYQSGFSYAWVSDMADYAWLDGTEARAKKLDQALGEGKLEELEAAAAPAVVEHYNEIWKYEPELSYQHDGFSSDGMRAINVATVTVKPGMGDEYQELVKEAIAALESIDAPVNWFAYSTPFGAGSYAYVSWGENRAALHSGPEMPELLTKAVGAEKMQEMFDHYVNCVAGEEQRDWGVRPELSYMGPEMMAEEGEAEMGAGEGEGEEGSGEGEGEEGSG